MSYSLLWSNLPLDPFQVPGQRGTEELTTAEMPDRRCAQTCSTEDALKENSYYYILQEV